MAEHDHTNCPVCNPDIEATMMSWHIVNSEEFKNGTKIDQDLYFVYDTNEIYRGEHCYTRFIELYDDDATLDAMTHPSVNRLYVSKTNLKGRIWTGSEWKTIIRPVDTEVTETSGNLVSSATIYKFVVEKITEAVAKNVRTVDYDEAEHVVTVTYNDETTDAFALTGLATNVTFVDNQLTLLDAEGNTIGDPVDLSSLSDVIAVDGKSIENIDGTLSMANFGKEYYKYNSADTILDVDPSYRYPGNMPEGTENAYIKVTGSWYKFVGGSWQETLDPPSYDSYYSKVQGWKSGLEPKVVGSTIIGFSIAWYEPSMTTVEGLQDAMTALQTDVAGVKSQIATNATEISNVKKAINTLNGDATVDGSVANQITTAINNLVDGDLEAIKNLVDWMNEHGTDAVQLSADVSANKKAIASLETLVGKLPEGTKATDVIGYIQEAIANITVDGTQFATAEQGAKADTAVQSVTVVEGHNGIINVDGTDMKVYEPEVATTEKTGIVTVDDDTITIDATGKLSVKKVTTDVVEGLNDTITNVTESVVDGSYVKTDSVATELNISAPSDEIVVSEKAIVNALTWKTGM